MTEPHQPHRVGSAGDTLQIHEGPRKGFSWRLMVAVALYAGAAAVAAWIFTILTMTPSGAERNTIILMFAVFALVTVAVAAALQWFTLRSLDRRILATALAGPLLVAVATLFGSRSMFISGHDSQFVIVLVGLATVLAVGIVQTLARPLLMDLARIRRVAETVGRGDLQHRTQVHRPDEVGDLAHSIDAMIDRLAAAESARDRAERERSVMLASLGHDARTPLTAMRAALEAVQDGISPDPDRYLASIEHDLTAVENLIDNIFLLGQIEAGRVAVSAAVVDVEGLAHICVETMTPLARQRGVRLTVNSESEARAWADRNATLRVLHNLVSNAIRHTPDHGEVTIAVTNQSANLAISVADSGAGFESGFIAAAFDQFTRAEDARDRAHGGAGLGLAVSKGLVQAQAGTIEAKPGPGGWVQFTLPTKGLPTSSVPATEPTPG